MDRRRIAVVGGGVAGLTAAHVLQKRADVLLFEAEDRLGGHADTHEVAAHGGRLLRIDTGFIVHNERTYPTLLRLFDELGVSTQASEMSMSVRCDGCGLQYAGARGGPSGLFAQLSSVSRGRYLRMLTQVPAFHRAARAVLAAGGPEHQTLGDFVTERRYSPYFVNHFVIPLVSAVWSCAPQTAMRYPAAYLFRFLERHGLLSVSGSPQWRTVTGGSVEYVQRIGKRLAALHTATPVRAVRRHATGVEITTDDGTTYDADAVVTAVHPDQALRMLADPTRDEQRILGAFRYSRNETVLHTDTSLLPSARRARASWNYLLPSCTAAAERVLVSYHMNRLQRLDAAEDYVVTLNGGDLVDGHRVLARMAYEHPVYTPESVAAQQLLPELTTGVTAYAGAYHGWGFHEDGCRSGVAAAAALGVRW
ncbi:NAD(P)/FAD-dependent oxidoreductase [Actinacidiphila bryophytorum]|uniref:Amine oxidase, flavin-containing n=1 Tax=Actinacidiphila bryophytorum TaxID=1436133 RepID=A0A9W4H486_9ACTN|nr:FAD-dependent oxidoreductase [Actinacidiphila bryophytorum]MBM9435795.1 FAD-dependent oxidoreductase [Actinacidiphila bryophytorum]MBN6541638.1 FAD-dependent oxidoreductase [Actinacidiphila bryophytorum]CAG7650197.1 Amine oxidase, flavin-containing [Actinacidiphila bryophytorum]